MGLMPPWQPTIYTWLMPAPVELPEGYVIGGRFRIEETLDLSEDTQLYRAFDRDTGRPMKLKRVPVGEDHELHWRETEILAMLDHPRLPTGGEVIEEDGSLYFVQTFIEGPTFRHRFKKEGGLTPEALMPFLLDALELLDYIHNLTPPVIHRDVKPANMVVMEDGRLAIIDFDLSSLGVRKNADVPLEDLTVAHTVGYAPPEQMIGRESYPSSDLYALAASMIYAATDIHPIHLFDAEEGRIRVPSTFPEPLAEVLSWMLVPRLEGRCPTARAAIERLRAR
jgi:serine/threonine protein kinase